MATGVRKPGEFCWVNMLTPQPGEARAFFGVLLGWTFVELPGMGYRVQVDGHDIGGLFDLEGPNTPPGTPPHIGVMIKVENADRAAEKVSALGGRAMPPFDVMEQGRMAVCFDPNGANFDVWQPKKGPGMDGDSSVHGAPSWFETLTSDVERARECYTNLFGWSAETMPMPDGTYTTFKLGDDYVAGMLSITPQLAGVPPHWATYFTVNNVDETMSKAAELGGSIVVPMHDVPNVGRFCGILSPQGVMFFTITYSPRG